MTTRLAVVSLIVLGIVLQNTCPFGLAEKTAMAAPTVHHHCPLKAHHLPGSKHTGRRDMQDMQKNFKPFTLMGFKTAFVGQPELLVQRAEMPLIDRYEEVIMPLPMKPPKSGLSADC